MTSAGSYTTVWDTTRQRRRHGKGQEARHRHLDHGANDHGVVRDETVDMGDSEIDAETSCRAWAPFLLVTGGYRKLPISALGGHACFSRYEQLALPIEAPFSEQC